MNDINTGVLKTRVIELVNEHAKLAQVVNDSLRLAVEEQLGRRGSRGHAVDSDVAPAQLLGQDAGHNLNRGLGGGIDAVGRLQ